MLFRSRASDTGLGRHVHPITRGSFATTCTHHITSNGSVHTRQQSHNIKTAARIGHGAGAPRTSCRPRIVRHHMRTPHRVKQFSSHETTITQYQDRRAHRTRGRGATYTLSPTDRSPPHAHTTSRQSIQLGQPPLQLSSTYSFIAFEGGVVNRHG